MRLKSPLAICWFLFYVQGCSQIVPDDPSENTCSGKQIPSPQAVDLMFNSFNARYHRDAHSAGFEHNQVSLSGPMDAIQAGGHTRFTGTSFVVDRALDALTALLTHALLPIHASKSELVQ